MTTINRRQFLQVLGVGGVAISQAATLQTVLADAVSQGGFMPTAITDRDPVMHAINRLTFGPTDALIKAVQEMGVDAFIQNQLNPDDEIDDSTFESAYANLFPYLSQSSSDLLLEYALARQDDPESAGRAAQMTIAQLQGNWYYRALASERQLHEVMAQFWANHFSIHTDSLIDIYLRVDDERNVARANPFGKFHDLLRASATSPAMLVYLDNATSRKEAPNENYARELLELHTLGVDGGYTEDDVKAVARAFTGWTSTRPRQGLGRTPGIFIFDPDMHDTDEKVVLGNIIPAGGGMEDGERVLEILAAHPSTARFISTKLVRRFVSDDAPSSLVDKTTQTYLDTDGDIRSILGVIFASEEFWNAAPKYKQPFEYVLSSLRAMNYEPTRFEAYVRALRGVLLSMGHVPFDRPSPDGYPDVGNYWMNNLLTRWNIAIAVAQGDVNGARGSLRAVLEANGIPFEAEPILTFIGRMLYGRDLNSLEIETITAYLTEQGTSPEALQDMIALLLAAPAFQYR